MFVETAIFLFILLVLIFCKDNFGNKKRPPGPFRLPLIGNLHQIAYTRAKHSHIAFDKLQKIYGSIMSIKLGTKETVVVSTHEDLQNILTKYDSCNDRPLFEIFEDRAWKKNLGIFFCNGELWNVGRRFVLRTLREFGFGKESSHSVISMEINSLIEDIQTKANDSNGVVKIKSFFSPSAMNVIWAMIGGKRFELNDSRLRNLVELNEELLKSGSFGADLSIAFPIFRKLFPGLTGGTAFVRSMNGIHNWIKGVICEYKNRPDYGENPECLIDVFLGKIDEAKLKNEKSEVFTDENMTLCILDLFQAGNETVNGTLSYALMLMALYPQVQKRIQSEISEVVGTSEVYLEHRARMVYTQATILEIYRFTGPAVLIPRKITKDFSYKGYTFKEGTIFTINFYSASKDPLVWEKPHEFHPERFLSEGVNVCNQDKFSAFGYGKRVCVGETLATSIVFLFFANLLRNFEFSKNPAEPDPTLEPLPAFAISPQPFSLIVNRRK